MSGSAVTKSVLELVSETPDVDNQDAFETLSALFAELRAKLDRRFALTLDPSAERFSSYCNEEGQGQGTLQALSGPEMDWMIHSWTGTPTSSFTNIHLTAWLGPQIQVPHLWMAMGTIPELFVYLDYGPRTDMYVDTDYMDRYFGEVNTTFMDVQNDPKLPSFISQDLCTRQWISPTGICLAGVKPCAEIYARLAELAHQHIDRWLGWVDEASPVAAEKRVALARRDLQMRRTIAERDPANVLVANIYGEPMKNDLVEALWGGQRVLKRPT
ncbi:MAG: hypothetical protein CMP23_05710 [Rickettsiales bacterium]|nr:hypothetical protein [Rickettsiales bacterium]|tara:strand:- start:2179 stop:2991 length:813 start_codon:yes stop_codon:yes gene_type:complete